MDDLTSLIHIKRFDIQVQTGLWIRVTPLSPYTKAMLINEAQNSVPEFDVEPFRKPIAGAKGDTFIDSKAPEYQRLEKERLRRVDMYYTGKAMNMSVQLMNEDKEVISIKTICDLYGDEIARMRAAGTSFIPDDDYYGIVRYILINEPSAWNKLIQALNDQMPLTGDEIMSAGFCTFQYPLAGKSPAKGETGTATPGVQGKPALEQSTQ